MLHHQKVLFFCALNEKNLFVMAKTSSSNRLIFLGVTVAVLLIVVYTFSDVGMSDEYVRKIQEYRQERDRMYRESKESPLDKKQRARFEGLAYYPPNIAFRIEATLERLPIPEPVKVPTSQQTAKEMQKFGWAHFSLNGKKHTLLLYKSAENAGGQTLFLPFADQTNGTDTYAAGRYIDLELRGDKLIIDFNFAYNPYCAYNAAYECPLPPAENYIDLPVQAGEKKWPGSPMP